MPLAAVLVCVMVMRINMIMSSLLLKIRNLKRHRVTKTLGLALFWGAVIGAGVAFLDDGRLRLAKFLFAIGLFVFLALVVLVLNRPKDL